MVGIELDEELIHLFHPIQGCPEDLIREHLFLELYCRHEISSDKASEWLEMERFEFMGYASRQGMPYMDMDERKAELKVQVANQDS